ncbi:MAG TPA: YbaY family lipoprotein [Thermoanaerobaculales bacterium]|nr:YbaY family lipoprotein [Thermoanaerobaculales bacterium]
MKGTSDILGQRSERDAIRFGGHMKHSRQALGSGFLLLAVAAGCARAPSQEAGPAAVAAREPAAEPRHPGLDLAGTEWVVSSVAGVAADADARPTVAFDGEGRVAGSAGCNRYGGRYALDGEVIAVGHLGATQMMCPPEQMEREVQFLDALSRAERAGIRDGALVLTSGEPSQELVLVRADPAPIVAGAVLYRERIALPPDAALTVRLLDVSRPGGTRAVLAEQRVAPTGQVPIPFEIAYDPALIHETMSCALDARIEAGGALLFLSSQPIPVITRGHPARDLEVLVERAAR